MAKEIAAGRGVRVRDWIDARARLHRRVAPDARDPRTATLLALLAAGFTLATAIGGRVLADRRRIGLLRAWA